MYPSPTHGQVIAALERHKLRYVIEPLRASSPGRAWSSGLRVMVDHHTAGKNSLAYLLNAGGRYPFVNSLIDRNGLVHILTTRSCWGTGVGGPWKGVAAVNSLHLVAWSTEVEDLGQGRTFTPAQLESLGRQNAALVSLGVPAHHEVNHRDWTDGTGGVSSVPLPTKGRKVDTRYDTIWLRANTEKYRIRPTVPQPPIPPVTPPLTIPHGKDDDMFIFKSHRDSSNPGEGIGGGRTYIVQNGFATQVTVGFRVNGAPIVESSSEEMDVAFFKSVKTIAL